MMKKKGKKSKATAKKVAEKKSSSQASASEKETAEVRKELVKLVKESAQEMVAAVIGEGKKGQVSPVKYLLEETHIFPLPEADVNAPSKYEECLAETLLDRLGIPKTPVAADEYAKDDEEKVTLPAKQAESEESSEVREEAAVGCA
jgi:hypothetical protein